MLDKTYRKHIKNSKMLNDKSKETYLKRLDIIQGDIWKNCKSVKNKVGKGKGDLNVNQRDTGVKKITGRARKYSMDETDDCTSPH